MTIIKLFLKLYSEVLKMNNAREYTVDFSKVQRWQDIHKVIKQDLDFPAYYGENLDALWDCLGEMTDSIIDIKGVHNTPNSKEFQVELEEVLEVFREAQQEFAEFITITFVD